MTSRFSVKGGLIAAAATLAVSLVPATAQADAVDDLLARIPAGQISCSQAESYWTNAADYDSKRSQALMYANFDSRGPQIRAAIGRMDEAINRCGLRNKTGNGNGTVSPAPSQPAPNQPAPNQPAPNRPAPNQPAPSNPAGLPVIDLSIPGQPSITMPLFNVAIVKIPDVNKIAQNSLQGTPLAQLSSR